MALDSGYAGIEHGCHQLTFSGVAIRARLSVIRHYRVRNLFTKPPYLTLGATLLSNRVLIGGHSMQWNVIDLDGELLTVIFAFSSAMAEAIARRCYGKRFAAIELTNL